MNKQRPVQITIRLHQDNEKEMRALKALQDAQQEGKTYAEILTELLEARDEPDNNAPVPETVSDPRKQEDVRITAEDVSRIVADALKAAGVGSGGTATDMSKGKSLVSKDDIMETFHPETYPEGAWPPVGTPEFQAVMSYRLKRYSETCDRIIQAQKNILKQHF